MRAVGKLCRISHHGVHTAHVRHAQIHQRHIRLVLPEKIDGLLAIRAFGYYAHIGYSIEQSHQALPHHVMVLYHHESDLAHR